MLCKCHWIVLYTVHFTAFCLGGGAFFHGHGVYYMQAGYIFAVRFVALTLLNTTNHFCVCWCCYYSYCILLDYCWF